MPLKTPELRRLYSRQWVAKRRQDWFANKTCSKCPSTHRLELHHLDPAKKVSHSIWSWSQSRRDAEIAKCEVLCHECHKIETRKQQSKPLVHGTVHGYKKKGCRCDPCTKAASARVALYKRLRLLGVTGFGPVTSTV